MHTYIIIVRRCPPKLDKMLLVTGDFKPEELAKLAKDRVANEPAFAGKVEDYIIYEVEMTGYANYTIGTIVNMSMFPLLDYRMDSPGRKYLGSFYDNYLNELEEQH